MQITQVPTEDLIPCIENSNYAVDRFGNVYCLRVVQRSRAGNIIVRENIKKLIGSTDKDGYRTYRMVINGKKKHVKGHRLVARAFLGCGKGLQVNHKNGDKKDNRVENLEWVTAQENNDHARRTGLWNKHMAKPKRKIHLWDYVSIYLLHKEAGFSRKKIAEMNNVRRQTIDTIINRVDWYMKELNGKLGNNLQRCR